MKPRRKQPIASRRNFLVSASGLVPTLLVVDTLGLSKTGESPISPPNSPSQNLLVGYIPPEKVNRGIERLHQLLSLSDEPQPRGDLQMPELRRSVNRENVMGSPSGTASAFAPAQRVFSAREAETARPIKIADLTDPGKFEKDYIKDAERIDVGDQQWLNDGVMVQFLGVFTADWQWKTGDQGSFMMNLKFKEVPNSCPKLSKAAIGSDFKAIKNGIIPAFGNFRLINGIKVDSDNPLTMSFSFVDVVDEKDKSLVLRLFEAVKKLPTVSGVLEGVAAPYIAAGTAILDVLGQNLLQAPTSNVRIWSETVQLEFRPATQGVGPRLKPGYYVIAGNRKNGGNPDWSQYQLRAADPNNSGLRRFLYERPIGSDKIVPVDFSYVLAYIDRKQT